MEYRPRIVDSELDELMGALPAIAIEGPKAVGKTATALRRAAHRFDLDSPDVLAAVAADPSAIDTDPGTVLVDEWHRHPAVFDHVRRQVDAGAPPGRYLLTGSATPTDAPSHSGAGRIVRVRMRPMALSERGLDQPTVSLAALLGGGQPEIQGTSSTPLAAYAEEILASGFPAIRGLSGRARRARLGGYIDRVVERDFADQGLRIRRPATLRAWLGAYAAATATTTSYNRLLDAATAGESDKPAKTTTIAYRDVLSQLWLLDPVPGWTPGRNRLATLTQAPKHHLADPAIAAQLMGIDADALLSGGGPGSVAPRDGTLLGHLFESLVTQSIQVYAQANEATVHHLRTQNGRQEVDLVVGRPDGRVVAVEVKIGATPDDVDVRHLHWLRRQLGDELLDAIVITAGRRAYRRPDGVAVVPAVLLGP